jgi:excisionase family DNA binding protein
LYDEKSSGKIMWHLGTGEPMEPTSNILTVRQLATYLNMASVTIYRLAARGELPGTIVGGQWRFHKQAIDEWLSRKPDRKRIKILVVDDELQIGELIQEALPPTQFHVQVAASGREATNALAVDTYQVAFIDLVLPDTTGVHLLKLIRESSPTTRTVIITGHPYSQQLADAFELGFFMVLKKPFIGEQIRSVVNDLVGSNRVQL